MKFIVIDETLLSSSSLDLCMAFTTEEAAVRHMQHLIEYDVEMNRERPFKYTILCI